ncbi:MAG: ATP-binding cassette domain-containing protein [candidate division Zixibacteria bacterium]|nr:ATP-binding cassette domain-containing protein [candidate division Zixibacteria bacterium]
MDGAHVTTPDAILDIKGLNRSVLVKPGAKRIIIDDFNFSFSEGQIYTIVGPSGSGKSSLLRLLNRLDERDDGEIIFQGESIDSIPVQALREKIALVFQMPYVFPGTVESNLLYSRSKKHENERNELIDLLNRVGLDEMYLPRNPENLSLGQQQRVALARSLSMEPEILLLDEPTSALDPGASRTIEELLTNLNQTMNLTLIIVTHNFRQALRLGGISLVLIDGRIIEAGPTKELFENPANEQTRKFIAGELR